MPIYEYNCPNCSEVFEEWVRNSEVSDFAPCPNCQTNAPRMVSQTTFILKGGGWYVTDYGKASERKAEKTANSSSTPANKTQDAKPAQKPTSCATKS